MKKQGSKKIKSFRLTDKAIADLAALADAHGISQSSVVELSIRAKAMLDRRRGILRKEQ